jgi:hypothetical protein
MTPWKIELDIRYYLKKTLCLDATRSRVHKLAMVNQLTRFSTSTTMTNIHVRRPLQINLHALLQQQAPTIDLGVESYENSTRNFLEAVAKYKNRSMTAIAERRRHEAHEKKKIMDKITVVED